MNNAGDQSLYHTLYPWEKEAAVQPKPSFPSGAQYTSFQFSLPVLHIHWHSEPSKTGRVVAGHRGHKQNCTISSHKMMLKYTIYSIRSSSSQNCQFPTRQSFAHSSQEMYFPIIKTIPLSISQIRTNSNGATLSLNLWLVNCTGIWLWESAPFFFFYYNKCITTCALSTTTLLLPTFSGTLQFSQYARGCLISEHPCHCPYQATHRAQRTWDEALSSACLAFLPRSACLYPAWLSPHPYCCPSPAFHISLGIHSHSTFKMPLEGCLSASALFHTLYFMSFSYTQEIYAGKFAQQETILLSWKIRQTQLT